MGDLLPVAAIVIGFGITVFTFRIQRELQVKEQPEHERDPDWELWLAWADYLVLAAVGIVALVFVPILIAPPNLAAALVSTARGACAAAMILQVG